MNLATFLKANFWAGLIGTLVFTPFGYAYEAWSVGSGSPVLKIGWLDAAMVVIAPVVMALAFSITALVAFPFVRYLEARGVISLLGRSNADHSNPDNR